MASCGRMESGDVEMPSLRFEGIETEGIVPKAQLDKLFGSKILHGTTTMAFKYKDGVIVVTDSRATSGATIGSQTTKKIIPVTRNIIATMAGGAADCQFWLKMMTLHAQTYELTHNKPISVAAISMLLANSLYSYKGYGISMGSTIVGVDEEGFRIYMVDNSGLRMEVDMGGYGSGSPYAYAVMELKYRGKEMGLEEAVKLGKEAISHAAYFDTMSGGHVNVFVVTREGHRQICFQDVDELYNQGVLQGN